MLRTVSRENALKKEGGNIGEFLATLFILLAMTVVVLSYMDAMSLVQDKMEISQLARRYILEMETTGCMDSNQETCLRQALEQLGVTDISLEGTTINPVGYSEPIVIEIRGKIKGEYDFQETRVSTSKN